MEIGFTGTRFGMNEKQRKIFEDIVKEKRLKEFHHGDCAGADEEAQRIIKKHHPQAKIYIHPPKDKKLRAFCKGDFIAPEKSYLVRDHDIVDACTELIAIPNANYEVIRSGTWATVRYAKKIGKNVTIIYPNGTLKKYK